MYKGDPRFFIPIYGENGGLNIESTIAMSPASWAIESMEPMPRPPK